MCLLTLTLGSIAEAIVIKVTVTSVLDDDCFFTNLQPPNPYLDLFAILLVLTD